MRTLVLFFLAFFAAGAKHGMSNNYEPASNAVQILQNKYFDKLLGYYTEADFWENMEAAHAVVDYMYRSGNHSFLKDLEHFFTIHPEGICLLPEGYDDRGWAVATYIRAYELTSNHEYLQRGKHSFQIITRNRHSFAAQYIFDEIDKHAWNSWCGGGYCWGTDTCVPPKHNKEPYKNAITNELGMFNAAKLHQHLNNDTDYLGKALRILAWFNESGMMGSNGLINDGLDNGVNGTNCRNNEETTWTYNQGVIIGALATLYNSTKDGKYLDMAVKILDGVVALMRNTNGCLLEIGGIHNRDGQGFKGIFIQHLGLLLDSDDISMALREKYIQLVCQSATSLLSNAKTPGGKFGAQWQGPVNATDGDKATNTGMVPQYSALMLLTIAGANNCSLS
eukprot:m.173123 g.173123  ORF g.173123 m.173123 type:complete len:393 (+) comp15383_c0_seq6:111-1289(+)